MPSYLTSDPTLTPDYNVPGEINPGITPGVWQTLRGPFQLPSSDYNQAMAEFDAREANPRSGIPDDQLKELTLERALEEQLSPFNVGMALGAQAVAPYSTSGRNYPYLGLGAQAKPTYIKSGGNVLQRNPMTGSLETVFAEQTKPGPTPLEKAIQAQLKVEYAAYAKATEPDVKGEHARAINGLRKQLEALTTPKVSQAPDQQWMVDPNSIPFGGLKDVQYPRTMAKTDQFTEFGGPGTRTPFSFIGGPEGATARSTPFMFSGAAAPPPVAPAANLPRILNIRRR